MHFVLDGILYTEKKLSSSFHWMRSSSVTASKVFVYKICRQSCMLSAFTYRIQIYIFHALIYKKIAIDHKHRFSQHTNFIYMIIVCGLYYLYDTSRLAATATKAMAPTLWQLQNLLEFRLFYLGLRCFFLYSWHDTQLEFLYSELFVHRTFGNAQHFRTDIVR